MKKAIQLILLISLAFSCVCQKKQSPETTNDQSKGGNQIPINNPGYSPGTFALSIRISDINENENNYQMKASINKVLGTGSGISHIFKEGETVSFVINKDYSLIIHSDYRFLFREIQIPGNQKPNLQFIKELK